MHVACDASLFPFYRWVTLPEEAWPGNEGSQNPSLPSLPGPLTLLTLDIERVGFQLGQRVSVLKKHGYLLLTPLSDPVLLNTSAKPSWESWLPFLGHESQVKTRVF